MEALAKAAESGRASPEEAAPAAPTSKALVPGSIPESVKPPLSEPDRRRVRKARAAKSERALLLQAGARQKRLSADKWGSHDPTGAYFDRREASTMEATAESLLALPTKPPIGAGGELVLLGAEAGEVPGIACTVEDPDLTIAIASRERLELAGEARSLNLAVDMAETINAKDSLRKGLAHQLAAMHQLAMRFAARSNDWLDRSSPHLGNLKAQAMATAEAQRAANALARLNSAYQEGMMTLQRMKTGGKQVVQVQHVTVQGGQTLVANTVKTGGRGGGRK